MAISFKSLLTNCSNFTVILVESRGLMPILLITAINYCNCNILLYFFSLAKYLTTMYKFI